MMKIVKVKPFKLSLFGKELSVRILFLSLLILGAYYVQEPYFSLGNYFILPIFTVIISFLSYSHFLIRFRWPKYNFIVLLLLSIIILSVIFVGHYTFDIIASYFLMFTLFYFITIGRYSQFDIFFLLCSYILSALILSCILLYQHRIAYLDMFRFSVFYSETEFYDANFLASFLLFPALFSFYFAWIKPIKRGRSICAISNIIILSALLATGSRAAMAGFVIGIFPIMRSIFFKFRLLFIILLFVCLILYFLPEELTERLFIKSYSGSSQNRRLEDWFYALKAIGEYPFFGSGFSTSSSVIYQLFRVNITAHNSFLAMLMNFGLIGSMPFMILLLKPMLKYKKSFLGQYMFSFYLAFLFNISIIEAITSFVFIIPFIIFHLLIFNDNGSICKT